MKGVMNAMHGLKPVLLMVLVQIAYTAVNVLFKLAINDGMSVKVATTYRLAFGSAFTVPLALVSERSVIISLLPPSSLCYFKLKGPHVIIIGNRST